MRRREQVAAFMPYRAAASVLLAYCPHQPCSCSQMYALLTGIPDTAAGCVSLLLLSVVLPLTCLAYMLHQVTVQLKARHPGSG